METKSIIKQSSHAKSILHYNIISY